MQLQWKKKRKINVHVLFHNVLFHNNTGASHVEAFGKM